AEVRLLVFEARDGGGDDLAERRFAMDEADVGAVEGVLDELEPVAGPSLGAGPKKAFALHFSAALQLRRNAFAEVGEQQARVVAGRIARKGGWGGERGAAVGMALGRDVRRAARVAVDAEVLAHNAHGL